MKIGRRSFLSFIIGGAAGTALSPLPWKVTDDLSIWTQNWPWTPIPPAGEVSFTTSTCTLCPAACGISVRKVDNRVVKIEGLDGHPVNDGGLCILGLSGAQLLYGPSRVETPLKRSGDRGSGHWTRISWDQAVAEVAAKLGELRTPQQVQSVACIAEAGRGSVPRLLDRFMTAYGSPNFIQTTSVWDAYEMAYRRLLGTPGPVGFDVERTDFLLSFGAGILDGWDSTVRMFRANSKRREGGGVMVQVEPRLSNTAAKSDRWVAVKPGSEAVLAMGMAYVIVREALYDKSFVVRSTDGFTEFADRLQSEFPLDAVEDRTGVDKATITDLARKFARARRPLAVCGRGKGASPQGVGEVMAVQALNALKGNINRPGGVWALAEPDYIAWDHPTVDAVAARGLATARIDGAGSAPFGDAVGLINRLAGRINAAGTSPVQAMLVAGGNPCYTLPDSAAVRQAFEKIPLVVSFSPFMDETAQIADYILPDHTNLERFEDIPAPAGFPLPFIGLSKPVVAPQCDTRHVGDTVMALAAALGGSVAEAFAWDSYEACIEETLGDKWDGLVEEGYWVGGAEGAAERFPAFLGRFTFPAGDIRIGVPPIEGDAKAFPLILIPYDTMRLASGPIGNTPFLTKTVPDTVIKGQDGFVEINPETARSLGLSEGRTAELKTPVGSAAVRVHLSERVGPGLVALPRGLGHRTPRDKYLDGKGVNYNRLVGPVEDPASGLDAAWGIRASLRKA